MKQKQLGKRNNNTASIFISISQEKQRARLTVYNKWSHTISKSGYVVVAVYENRLYFKEASEKDGWFLSKTNNKNARCMCIKNDNIYRWIDDGGIGSYKFRYDEELSLYYIEKMIFEKSSEK